MLQYNLAAGAKLPLWGSAAGSPKQEAYRAYVSDF